MKVPIVLLCCMLWGVDGVKKHLCAPPSCKCQTYDAFTPIQGEYFNVSDKAGVEHSCGFETAASLVDNAMIGYCNVDFGQGAKAIHLRISMGSSADKYPLIAKLYLDKLSGTPLAMFNVQRVGDWCDFIEWKVFLKYIPTGVHHLYFRFTADPTDYGVGVFNLDWFKFIGNLTYDKPS